MAEYTGPRLSKEDADALYDGQHVTYLFGLGDGSVVIDGQCMAMYINHSCEPNCETVEVRGRVWIKALRRIEPGEEITYDYCLYDGGDEEARCNCGAENCRGSMYSEKEVRKRKRRAGTAAQRSQNGKKR